MEERKWEISGVYGSIECKSNKQAMEKRGAHKKLSFAKIFYFMNKLDYMIAFQDGSEKKWLVKLLKIGKKELRIMSFSLLKCILLQWYDDVDNWKELKSTFFFFEKEMKRKWMNGKLKSSSSVDEIILSTAPYLSLHRRNTACLSFKLRTF